MKNIFTAVVFILAAPDYASHAATLQGTTGPPNAVSTGVVSSTNASASPNGYEIVARGPNGRTWQRINVNTNASGKARAITNRFIELETGMHVLKNGQWIESSESIQVQATGGALAQNGPYQAYFPGDIYNDSLRLTTPEGKVLESRPVGLAYADDQRSEWIAELKPGSAADLLSSGNQVLYTDICTGCRLGLSI